MRDAFSVPFGAAIAVVGALAFILIDWERIRARTRHARRRGIVVLHSVPIEGGLNDLTVGIFILGAALTLVVCFFTGAVVIVEWIWGLA